MPPLLDLVAFILILCSAIHEGAKFESSYRGFQVYRAIPTSESQVGFLRAVSKENDNFDFWTKVGVDAPVDIMVPPGNNLKERLSIENIEHQLIIADLQNLLDTNNSTSSNISMDLNHDMTWDAYHDLKDIDSYLDYLEATYDDVTTEVIGQSSEMRDMRVASVCRGGCGNKPALWIHGGSHAREWVTLASATWILKQLVESADEHPDLLDQADWHILPSINPDGYVYTRQHDRMWLKTRSDHESFLGCKGVNLNLNWGFHWGEGGSHDKCSSSYIGPQAWSEPESDNVQRFLEAKSREKNIVLFSSLHSYGESVYLPWSFTDIPPDDYDEIYALAKKGVDVIGYSVSNNGEYGIGGSPMDWAYHAGFGFSAEMYLRDTGRFGFLLPSDQIIPTSEEAWAFHVTVIREILAADISMRYSF